MTDPWKPHVGAFHARAAFAATGVTLDVTPKIHKDRTMANTTTTMGTEDFTVRINTLWDLVDSGEITREAAVANLIKSFGPRAVTYPPPAKPIKEPPAAPAPKLRAVVGKAPTASKAPAPAAPTPGQRTARCTEPGCGKEFTLPDKPGRPPTKCEEHRRPSRVKAAG